MLADKTKDSKLLSKPHRGLHVASRLVFSIPVVFLLLLAGCAGPNEILATSFELEDTIVEVLLNEIQVDWRGKIGYNFCVQPQKGADCYGHRLTRGEDQNYKPSVVGQGPWNVSLELEWKSNLPLLRPQWLEFGVVGVRSCQGCKLEGGPQGAFYAVSGLSPLKLEVNGTEGDLEFYVKVPPRYSQVGIPKGPGGGGGGATLWTLVEFEQDFAVKGILREVPFDPPAEW